MEGGVDEVGAALTGGLTARAVEPSTGPSHAPSNRTCLNCGTTITRKYCGECGQQSHVHRTLSAFWHDVAHSVLHFDGKIWRTLPLLAWHPGELTRRYVEGERAKFVSPMALFLFSVFLMFAVVSALGGPFGSEEAGGNSAAAERAEEEQEYKKERAETLAELAEFRAQRQRLLAAGEETLSVDIDIRNAQAQLALQERLFEGAVARVKAQEQREKTQADSKAKDKEREGETEGYSSDFRAIGETGWTPLDEAVGKASKNPSLLAYKIQTNAYKFSWALIPISVPFVWLLFLHRPRYRKYKAYDHVVFVTYSIAFMSLGFIALTLMRPLGAGEAIAGTAIAFGPPIHMYRQLRGAYSLSRWSAVWRTFLLLVFAFVAAGLFLTLLLTLGVLG